MNVTVGKTIFDNVACDRADDVLYLHVGDPGTAVDFDESPGDARSATTWPTGWSASPSSTPSGCWTGTVGSSSPATSPSASTGARWRPPSGLPEARHRGGRAPPG